MTILRVYLSMLEVSAICIELRSPRIRTRFFMIQREVANVLERCIFPGDFKCKIAILDLFCCCMSTLIILLHLKRDADC